MKCLISSLHLTVNNPMSDLISPEIYRGPPAPTGVDLLVKPEVSSWYLDDFISL